MLYHGNSHWEVVFFDLKTKKLLLFGSFVSSWLCLPLYIPKCDQLDWIDLASPHQTVSLTQLFHSSSFLFFAQGVNQPPTYLRSLSYILLWVPILLPCGLSLGSVGLFPNSLKSDFPHLSFAFPWLTACLSFSFCSLFFSLPLQGRSVCGTVPECWTLRCWSVHLKSRFVRRWGNKSW